MQWPALGLTFAALVGCTTTGVEQEAGAVGAEGAVVIRDSEPRHLIGPDWTSPTPSSLRAVVCAEVQRVRTSEGAIPDGRPEQEPCGAFTVQDLDQTQTHPDGETALTVAFRALVSDPVDTWECSLSSQMDAAYQFHWTPVIERRLSTPEVQASNAAVQEVRIFVGSRPAGWGTAVRSSPWPALASDFAALIKKQADEMRPFHQVIEPVYDGNDPPHSSPIARVESFVFEVVGQDGRAAGAIVPIEAGVSGRAGRETHGSLLYFNRFGHYLGWSEWPISL